MKLTQEDVEMIAKVFNEIRGASVYPEEIIKNIGFYGEMALDILAMDRKRLYTATDFIAKMSVQVKETIKIAEDMVIDKKDVTEDMIIDNRDDSA